MDVIFEGKVYTNFEKNPKTRSEWAEAQVKSIIENKVGFPTFSTNDLINERIKLDKDIQLIIDTIFKNKDMHSIDLFFINENESKRKQREKDKKFVKELIDSKKPYNLGKFFKKRQYIFHLEYDQSGKRIGIYISPLIFFVEVKSFLKNSKPPIISFTGAYKLNYALKELKLPIIIAFVAVDLKDKSAEIGLKLVKEFKGLGDDWMKFIPKKSKGFPRVRLAELPEVARKPLPLKVLRGKLPYINIQFLEPKNEIEIKGKVIFADKVKIIEKQPNPQPSWLA